jgi:CRP-like cAMP-binding protein
VSAEPRAALGRTFYRMLSHDEQEELLGAGKPQVYPPGSLIAVEGEPANSVAVLLHGFAIASWMNGTDQKNYLGIYTPGDLIGAEPILLGHPRQEAVSALGRCRALVISASQFASLSSEPGTGIGRALSLTMARRLESFEKQIGRMSVETGAARLAHVLIGLAEQAGVPAGSGVTIPAPLSQEVLASLATVSRATATRALNGWRREHVIDTRYKEITIIDIQRLRAIADGRSGHA